MSVFIAHNIITHNRLTTQCGIVANSLNKNDVSRYCRKKSVSVFASAMDRDSADAYGDVMFGLSQLLLPQLCAIEPSFLWCQNRKYLSGGSAWMVCVMFFSRIWIYYRVSTFLLHISLCFVRLFWVSRRADRIRCFVRFSCVCFTRKRHVYHLEFMPSLESWQCTCMLDMMVHLCSVVSARESRVHVWNLGVPIVYHDQSCSVWGVRGMQPMLWTKTRQPTRGRIWRVCQQDCSVVSRITWLSSNLLSPYLCCLSCWFSWHWVHFVTTRFPLFFSASCRHISCFNLSFGVHSTLAFVVCQHSCVPSGTSGVHVRTIDVLAFLRDQRYVRGSCVLQVLSTGGEEWHVRVFQLWSHRSATSAVWERLSNLGWGLSQRHGVQGTAVRGSVFKGSFFHGSRLRKFRLKTTVTCMYMSSRIGRLVFTKKWGDLQNVHITLWETQNPSVSFLITHHTLMIWNSRTI